MEEVKLELIKNRNYCDFHSGEEINGELLKKYMEEQEELRSKNLSFEATAD